MISLDELFIAVLLGTFLSLTVTLVFFVYYRYEAKSYQRKQIRHNIFTVLFALVIIDAFVVVGSAATILHNPIYYAHNGIMMDSPDVEGIYVSVDAHIKFIDSYPSYILIYSLASFIALLLGMFYFYDKDGDYVN